MSENNPFGATEVAVLFLSMAVETALRRAMREIDGKTDEEIMQLVVTEHLRKESLMTKVRSH
jgi:hypothetical protein